MLYKQYNIYPTPEAIAAYSARNVAVPSYVFSTVSDFLSFSGRPQVGSDAWNAGNLADFLLMWGDQPFNQFQYANMSGVLSNMSKQQLVAICRQNGVQASVEQFGGLDGAGSTAATGVNTGYAMKSGMRVATAGAPLVLRPGKDFPLPLGVSAGTTGNVQLQYNITLFNNSPVASKFDILTMALSTSYLIIVNGACKVGDMAHITAKIGARSMAAEGAGTTSSSHRGPARRSIGLPCAALKVSKAPPGSA
jgi:hypothetical protein